MMLLSLHAVQAYHNLPANILSVGSSPLINMITAGKTCSFAEGPAPHPTEDYLLYSCFNEDSIRKIEGGVESIFKANAQTNGLVFDATGRLFGVQRANPSQVIEVDLVSTQYTPLTSQPFESLNDLALDASGGIYFTDYNGNTVFYRSAAGAVTPIDSNLQNPNGVNLSPDGTKLLVSDHGADEIFRYTITSPGSVTGKVSFYTGAVRPDGMAVDTEGNLWTSSSTGVHVLNSEGLLLGQVSNVDPPTGDFAVSNVALGLEKTLYITASDGAVYSIPTLMAGQALNGEQSPPPVTPPGASLPPPPPLGSVGDELGSPEKTGGISGMTMGCILMVCALAYGGYSFNKAKKEAEAKGVTLTAGEWAKTESEKVKAKVQAEMEKRKKPKGAAGKAPTAMAAVPPPAPGGAGYTAPAPLPEGWKEMQDENSGRPYFYNTRTGSSAWVRPES